MLLNLTDLSDEPLQAQIIRQIRAKILNGSLEAGAALPSIRGLARDTRVSVITVQRAYEFLERENLIYSRRGKGFFISAIQPQEKLELAADKLKESMQPVLQAALNEGLSKQEIIKTLQEQLADL